MLMQKPVESSQNLAAATVPAETVRLPLEQEAANASRWAVSGAFARRLRRQRRIDRAARRSSSGWSIRAW